MSKRLPRTMHGKDITGERFGLLVALRPTAKLCQAKCRIWVCECKCGNQVEVSTRYLKGKTMHCGCLDQQKRDPERVARLVGDWLRCPIVGVFS